MAYNSYRPKSRHHKINPTAMPDSGVDWLLPKNSAAENFEPRLRANQARTTGVETINVREHQTPSITNLKHYKQMKA